MLRTEWRLGLTGQEACQGVVPEAIVPKVIALLTELECLTISVPGLLGKNHANDRDGMIIR
jgi:hypothetical protein